MDKRCELSANRIHDVLEDLKNTFKELNAANECEGPEGVQGRSEELEFIVDRCSAARKNLHSVMSVLIELWEAAGVSVYSI